MKRLAWFVVGVVAGGLLAVFLMDAAEAAEPIGKGVNVYRCEGARGVRYSNLRCSQDEMQSRPWLVEGVVELHTKEWEAAMRGGRVPTTGAEPVPSIAHGGAVGGGK